MTDAEWVVVRNALPVPAWPECRGGQPETGHGRKPRQCQTCETQGLRSVRQDLVAGAHTHVCRVPDATPSAPHGRPAAAASCARDAASGCENHDACALERGALLRLVDRTAPDCKDGGLPSVAARKDRTSGFKTPCG